MQHAKRLFLAAGVILLGVISPAYAVENGGVGGRPANPRSDNPRSKSIFVYDLKPGETVSDAVVIVNSTDVRKSVEVYAADAQIASGGAFSCEQKADTLDQEGSWIKLEKNALQLEPFTEQPVNFTLAVPNQVSVGEHNACIAIQAVEPATSSAINGVQLSFRSAIRVAVTVPGDIKKELSFESITVSKNKNKYIVTERLRNSGNVSLDTQLKTSLVSFLNIGQQTIEGEYPILSGQTAEFNFEFNKPFWGGLYQAFATASYNPDPSVTLGKESEKPESVRAAKTIFIMPALPALLIYFLLVAFLVAPFTHRRVKRRRHITLKSSAITHKVASGEDINSISERYSMPWKQLVTLNKLKAPYSLQKGQELLVILPENYETQKVEKSPKKSVKKKSSKKKA